MIELKTLQRMLLIQNNINHCFSGLQWRNIPLFKYKIAANSEFNEFMEELADEWKWWVPVDAGQKVAEEFVDSVAFSLAVILHGTERTELQTYLDINFDSMKSVSDIYKYTGIESILHTWCQFIEAKDLRSQFIFFLAYVKQVGEHIGLSDSELYDTFTAKHDKNLRRISSGYMKTGNKDGLE